ncbi:MAG: Brp/Blh family beta-carotene 15,15'-dioxygenase [Acidobacteriota bacterium]
MADATVLGTHRQFSALLPWGMAFAVPTVPENVQVAVLAIGVVCLGLPHGALDHLVARPALVPRWGRAWLPLFLLAYLGLAAVALAAWIWLPAVTLLAFLALSVVHFGGDASDGEKPSPAAVMAWGGAPVILPCWFHPAEVAAVFDLLVVGGDEGGLESIVRGAALPALLLWSAAVLWHHRGLLYRIDRAQGLSLATLVGLVVLFARLPPLMAFAIYFCGIHSLRHLLELRSEVPAAQAARPGRWLVFQAAPLTLATVGLALLAGPALTADLQLSEAVLRLVFWGLAALTVPHMLLLLWWHADRASGREAAG